jgi:hypothetical protein
MPKKDFAETLLATRSIQRMKQKIADLEARLAALEG